MARLRGSPSGLLRRKKLEPIEEGPGLREAPIPIAARQRVAEGRTVKCEVTTVGRQRGNGVQLRLLSESTPCAARQAASAFVFMWMFWVWIWSAPIFLLLLLELAFGVALGPNFEIANRREDERSYWYLVIFHTSLFVVILGVSLIYYFYYS
jgi:hypothetical protein